MQTIITNPGFSTNRGSDGKSPEKIGAERRRPMHPVQIRTRKKIMERKAGKAASRQGSGTPCILVGVGWMSTNLLRGMLEYTKKACLATVYTRNPDYAPSSLDRIAGVVGAFPENGLMLGSLLQANIPVVDLAHACRKFEVPRVLPDNAAIGEMAAMYFRNRGFKRLAGIDVRGDWVSLERLQAFARAAQKSGLAATIISSGHRKFSVGNPGPELFAWVSTQLQGLTYPTGVFCCNDDHARYVMNVALQCGLQVPEDVAVLGVDCDPMVCDFTPVSLSSIDSNLYQLGYQGVALLHKIIHGGSPSSNPVLIPPVHVVTRKSTDLFAVEDPHTAAILKYIHAHFLEKISAEDAISTVPRSRSESYLRFKQEVGRSVGQEILRLRLKEAARLLMKSDEKLYSIAITCGFSTPNAFCHAFKAHMGITPGEFRDRQHGGFERHLPHFTCQTPVIL